MHGVVLIEKVEGSFWVCSFAELRGTASQFAPAAGSRKRSSTALNPVVLKSSAFRYNRVP